MRTPESVGRRVGRYAVGVTVATGAATLAYRLTRPLLSRLGALVRRREPDVRADAASRLSLRSYAELHEGMSASALVRLLGPTFREVNRTEIPGAETRTLVWTTDDGRAVHAVLQNDRLVAKAERGLT